MKGGMLIASWWIYYYVQLRKIYDEGKKYPTSPLPTPSMAVSQRREPVQAGIRLKIAVIGGGISGQSIVKASGIFSWCIWTGLAAAYALTCAGHDVMIIVKDDRKSQVCHLFWTLWNQKIHIDAHIYSEHGHHSVSIYNSQYRCRMTQSLQLRRSPPNMTRILYRWGLKPFLDQMAEKTGSLILRSGTTQSLWQVIYFEPIIIVLCSGSRGDLIGIMQFDEDFLRDQMVEYLFLRVCHVVRNMYNEMFLTIDRPRHWRTYSSK